MIFIVDAAEAEIALLIRNNKEEAEEGSGGEGREGGGEESC